MPRACGFVLVWVSLSSKGGAAKTQGGVLFEKTLMCLLPVLDTVSHLIIKTLACGGDS